MLTLAQASFDGATNDGLVTLDSCQVRREGYSASGPDSQWYLFAGNHEDSACMHGDAHGRDARPCSWFGARVEESLTGRGAKCCSVVPIGR